MPSVDFNLYLITDRSQTAGRPLLQVVEAALEGGVRAVQLREKDLSPRDLLPLATDLRRLTHRYGARLFVNDRADIALAVGADGVHLGAAGLPLHAVRQLAGGRLLIGYSAHGVEEARQAEREGADLITFGPVYPTPSKAIYGPPLGLEQLARAASHLSVPVFALGGVSLPVLPDLLRAGIHGVALISAVIAADDPRHAAAAIVQTLANHARS